MTEQDALNLLINVTAELRMTRSDHARVSEALRVIQRVLVDNDKRKESKSNE